ncbi:S-methyl-5-thioribose kinase [Salinibacterium soli]|uniref:S-methyl-5-thioribose kinase n=1 Tax=Antiquaquibacter soli TaxID=3064523 RepID=A0ABT9BV26_9MICO|nr:S-methyl-5-thioribose kinase [Protaetiibacter sp. WY-16]MDO7883646.1 S-methyl-5-thioribose kinase [Protaetiibacter sp. WY-16]
MTVPVLTVATVPEYIAARPHLAAQVDPSTLSVIEVGDGNLNLVFIARDASGRSITLKQSLPYVRLVGESWPLSQDRILAEGRGYDAAVAHSPDTIPAYFGLDVESRTIAMEDLSGWTVWRRALNEGRISPGAAAVIGRHVARVAFGTSAFGLESDALIAARAGAANPDLCKITEDLVFTHPYVDHDGNSWVPELEDAVLALREGELTDHAAALKYTFMTRSEALLHGDLHTGSVFVPNGPSESPAKIFDLEFGFYGPVGFDLGAFFGNTLLAQARSVVLERPAEFQGWLAGLVGETWSSFESEFRRLWPSRVDPFFSDAVLEEWLRSTWQDAVGFGGLKAIRRIVGLAKASDIQSLDPSQHVAAATAVLHTARAWVEGRELVATPAQLAERTAAGLGL